MTELVVSKVRVEIDEVALVRDADFSLSPGELVALLGPNGAGKSSLVKASLGLIPIVSGQCRLGGQDVVALNPQARARQLSYLPQNRPLAWPNTVRDIVALGRFCHGAALGRLGPIDREAVAQALSACHLNEFAHRRADTLSGGELARVHCARAFASQTPLLIADEPTAALDPHHQFKVMDLFQRYVSSGGGALVILHDLELAARYATRLIWMKQGEIVADGPPASTLTAKRIQDVYAIDAEISDGHIRFLGAA